MSEKPDLRADVVPCSARPIRFEPSLCIGCNRCLEACQVDVFLPSPEKGAPPLVVWPGECWYCGSCVQECPCPGAIALSHPLMNRTRFVPVEEPVQTRNSAGPVLSDRP